MAKQGFIHMDLAARNCLLAEYDLTLLFEDTRFPAALLLLTAVVVQQKPGQDC